MATVENLTPTPFDTITPNPRNIETPTKEKREMLVFEKQIELMQTVTQTLGHLDLQNKNGQKERPNKDRTLCKIPNPPHFSGRTEKMGEFELKFRS